jgi:hypothetical protein
MVTTLRAMPGGIRLFLVYALLVLAGIGVSLPAVVAEAIGAPLTFTGVVVMALLAYTIFTTTLVLQRKQAARGLALGLASLLVPAVLLLVLGGFLLIGAALAVFALVLIRALLGERVRGWLSED